MGWLVGRYCTRQISRFSIGPCAASKRRSSIASFGHSDGGSAPMNGHSAGEDERSFFGHCRHSGGLDSKSAMSWNADGGGVEQSDGSFERSRTHTPDPPQAFAMHRSGRTNRP
jgi:hypothetical protein